jgi:hypothetical protein
MRMYIDASEVVRVRVEAEEFVDDEPGPPKATEGVQHIREAARPPYSIIVRSSSERAISLLTSAIPVFFGGAGTWPGVLVES